MDLYLWLTLVPIVVIAFVAAGVSIFIEIRDYRRFIRKLPRGS